LRIPGAKGAVPEYAKKRVVTDNDDSRIGGDALMRMIREQIATNSIASTLANGSTNLAPETMTLFAEIENDLATVDQYSRPRTSVGRTRIFGLSVPFGAFLLKLHAFIFRDQRNANAAIVQALRTSLQLNVRLAADLQALRALVERGPTPVDSSNTADHL
jgi:hypothetical protein